MKTARSITPVASIRSSTRSQRAAASSPFNARGVVERPSFTLARPAVAKGGIEFAIHSHQVEEGRWIAEAIWLCRDGSIPVDGMPLHKGSRRFETRSEAVDEAMSRALRQIRSQAHRKSSSAPWLDAIESLQAWMAEAIHHVRAKDETLPLRGATVIDLFAGGLGGFGMGLASLGATVSLACEIDQQAMATYEANVRPKTTHADICGLEGTKLKADIVTMGLICQAFSKAGKGLGFADPKLASVYRHALRVVSEIDAKVIVIECARQLLTNKGGKDADELLATLMRAGYRVQHRALNAACFGVPQSRERSFIVATRIGLAADELVGFMFPSESEPTAVVADVMEYGVAAEIPAAEIVMRRAEPTERTATMVQLGDIAGRTSQGYRVYSANGLGPTLTASGGGRARFSGPTWSRAARALSAQGKLIACRGCPNGLARTPTIFMRCGMPAMGSQSPSSASLDANSRERCRALGLNGSEQSFTIRCCVVSCSDCRQALANLPREGSGRVNCRRLQTD